MPFIPSAIGGIISAAPTIWSGIKSIFGGDSGKNVAELGGSALGGWLGSKFSKPSAEAQQAMNTILEMSKGNQEQAQSMLSYMPGLMDTFGESVPRARYQIGRASDTTDRAASLFDAANAQFNRAEEAYQPALDYGNALLKGGPTAMQAISPEVSAIRGQGEQARSQLSQLAPRGGGRAMSLLQLPGQEQQQITNLLSQARQFGAELVPKVASGLTQIGQGRTSLGSGVGDLARTQGALGQIEAQIGQIAGELGISAGELATRLQQIAMYGPSSILDYDIRNRMLTLPAMQQFGQAGGNIGGSIWDIITNTSNARTPSTFPAGTRARPTIYDIPLSANTNPGLNPDLWPTLP